METDSASVMIVKGITHIIRNGGAVMINVIVAAAFVGVLVAKVKFYEKYSHR